MEKVRLLRQDLLLQSSPITASDPMHLTKLDAHEISQAREEDSEAFLWRVKPRIICHSQRAISEQLLDARGHAAPSHNVSELLVPVAQVWSRGWPVTCFIIFGLSFMSFCM